MLHRGEIVYRGAPEGLRDKARGHAWTVTIPGNGLDELKKEYPVIASVPNGDGWDVQVVADHLEGYEGTPIEPNLEHAYVYFHEFLMAKE
jgi:hypothetical protein